MYDRKANFSIPKGDMYGVCHTVCVISVSQEFFPPWLPFRSSPFLRVAGAILGQSGICYREVTNVPSQIVIDHAAAKCLPTQPLMAFATLFPNGELPHSVPGR